METESFETESGEALPKIFPQDADGQAMRWSKSREIYEIAGIKVFQ